MQTYLFYRSVIQTVVFTFNTLDPQVKPEDDIVSIVILTPYQVRGKLQWESRVYKEHITFTVTIFNARLLLIKIVVNTEQSLL